MGTESEEPTDATPDDAPEETSPDESPADGSSSDEQTPDEAPPEDLAPDQPPETLLDPSQPRPVEEVDDLSALAYAATEAMPQLAIYRRVDIETRAGAALFDVFLYIILSIIVFVLYRCAGGGENNWLSVIFVTGWLLWTAAEVFFPGTLGKKLLGIRIAADDFGPSTRSQRLRRWLVRRIPDLVMAAAVSLDTASMVGLIPRLPRGLDDNLGVLIFVSWVAVFVAFAFCVGQRKQSLYDRWFGTAVIQDNDEMLDRRGGFNVLTPSPPTLPPDRR
jgi:uncharacterized RDD family membrane protein YckC